MEVAVGRVERGDGFSHQLMRQPPSHSDPVATANTIDD